MFVLMNDYLCAHQLVSHVLQKIKLATTPEEAVSLHAVIIAHPYRALHSRSYCLHFELNRQLPLI